MLYKPEHQKRILNIMHETQLDCCSSIHEETYALRKQSKGASVRSDHTRCYPCSAYIAPVQEEHVSEA